jgi:hypothetical protein
MLAAVVVPAQMETGLEALEVAAQVQEEQVLAMPVPQILAAVVVEEPLLVVVMPLEVQAEVV